MNQIAPFAATGVVAAPELFLVDGSSFVFRAHFQAQNQDPRYNFRSDGLPTGATRFFTTKMLQIVRDGAAGVKPTHMAVAFDVSRKGWRRDIYPGYKASRPDHSDDLVRQMPIMREVIRSLGVEPVELELFEADDIIATYCRLAVEAGFMVTIISADKDLMQLVGDQVRFYDFQSGVPNKPGYRPERNYDAVGVAERWDGATPNMIADVQALIGDKTDDIPGVDRIGIKTAVALLGQFGTLDNLLENASTIKQAARREAIMASIDSIRISRKLVSLDSFSPVSPDLSRFELGDFDALRLLAFTKALEFDGITKQVSKHWGVEAKKVLPDPRFALEKVQVDENGASAIEDTVAEVCGTVEALKAFLGKVLSDLAVEPFYGADGIVGIGLSTGPGHSAYIPIGHGDPSSLFGVVDGQVEKAATFSALSAVLEDTSVRKIGFDIKTAWMDLMADGVVVSGFDDVMLMAYAEANGTTRIDLDSLSNRRLRYALPSIGDALGTGKSKRDPSHLTVEEAASLVAVRAEVVLRLHADVSGRMNKAAAWIYETVDLPLMPVLARMEDRGISVDQNVLAELSSEFGGRMASIEAKAHSIANIEFSISSPKQVGEVLFDELGLPGGTKTAGGQWETGADTLATLAQQGYELPAAVIEWRQVAKLKSTYTDPLRSHARASSRVHTTYNQAAVNTGRLSSNDPNLQNIPVRTEDGRKIRTAFVAKPGCLLISADYSQIELRLLAEMADIPRLKQAFADGVDIHAMTASEMFGVPVAGMPADIRRSAKAINFGIVYGISAFGLSSQLGIPVNEAANYINKYFDRFPGIRAFQEATKELVHANGYVDTVFGRRLHFPQISRLKGNELAAVERAAINAPIQGTAADIIRRAMVRMEPAMEDAGLYADMLLQVHDELVFEVPQDQADAVMPLIVQVMENACNPDFEMSVRLEVGAHSAANWNAAHA